MSTESREALRIENRESRMCIEPVNSVVMATDDHHLKVSVSMHMKLKCSSHVHLY